MFDKAGRSRTPIDSSLSQLMPVAEALATRPLADLPDALIEEEFVAAHRVRELLDMGTLRLLSEIDRRGTYERDGHLSAAGWLVAKFKMAWGAARDMLRVARALAEMPETRRAVEAGDVSMSGARLLARARDADADAFERSETMLVDAARIHSITDLGKVTAYWRRTVETERLERGEDTLRARRRLHASVLLDGMVRLDGDLDPESGETFLTALGALMDSETRSRPPTGAGDGDDRTAAQRRADALAEISRQWLDRADRPIVAGERPHVTVTVDVDELKSSSFAAQGRRSGASEVGAVGSSARTCELDHVGPVHAEVARRLACDASVMRIVMAGCSEPLDVGRRTSVVPPSIRRAVIVRDRMCRFPGCERPQTWCEAHHVVHWADGGSTALSNLILLCRRHHRMVHAPSSFRLEPADDGPVFRRPDGSVLDNRAPPNRAA
jgi:hypothetical protein